MERGSRIPGYVFPRIGEKFNGFYFNVLPFQLTGAQKRVLKEIRADMKTGKADEPSASGRRRVGKDHGGFHVAFDGDRQ